MSSRNLSLSANWDDVWADYDARQPAPAPMATPARPQYPAPAVKPMVRGGRVRWSALLVVPLVLAGWLSAPYATAWTLVNALEGHGSRELGQHLDLPALQSSLRDSLLLRADSPKDGQANVYLRAMTREIGDAWASPMALVEVVRARGVPQGAATEALRNIIPTGLSRFEMPLRGSGAPMALQLELTGEVLAPRWQVTGVRLEQLNRVPTFAVGPMRPGAPR